MTTRTKYLAYAATPVLALALFAGSSASAHGMFAAADPETFAQHLQAMFQEQATLLGTTMDVVKNAWAQGKSVPALAKELGLSEADLKAKQQVVRESQLKSQLQSLVSKGIITQVQADQRLAAMKQRQSERPGRGMGMGQRHGNGWGRP